MKDLLIGTITGISAAIAMAFFTQKPRPLITISASPDQVLLVNESFLSPATQPDPSRHKLEKIIDRVEVKNGRLDKLLNFLADTTNVNLAVNWRALESAGIAASCSITLNLHELPARTILKQALTQAGGGNVKLAYRINDGIVTISTADDLQRDIVTRVYDVRDIVAQAIARNISIDNKTTKPTTIPSNLCFGAATAADGYDMLVKLIQENIEPTIWRDAGGAYGGIRAFAGSLVVTLPIEQHEELQELLARLRHPQK